MMKECYEALLIKELLVNKHMKPFFHPGVCCQYLQNEKFNVKKLFVSQACPHVLHYMYLYMSSLSFSQKRHDIKVCSVNTWECGT